MVKITIAALFIGLILFTSQFLLTKDEFAFHSKETKDQKITLENPPVYPTWNPNKTDVKGVADIFLAPTSKAALTYSISDEKVVYGSNIETRLPMASLTKVMTALIALEQGDKIYRVSETALVGENSMGLTAGEILTTEELLYGLLLPSGNDAAEVLAQGSIYGRKGFVDEMNNRAKQLEMYNTHFTNPSGLEGDGDQYTTTMDLLRLTKVAMQNSTFRKIVGTFEKELPYSNKHKYFHLYNETNLLTSYPGVIGVKTGFTWEAGLCLITFYEHDDTQIVGIILGSENRRQEMKDLLDYTLINLGKTPPIHE